MRPACHGPLNKCEYARKTDGLELGTSSPASLAGPQPHYRRGSDSLSRPQHGMLEGSDDPVFFFFFTQRCGRRGSYGRLPRRLVISLYEVRGNGPYEFPGTMKVSKIGKP